jgi:hypothetical protein
MNQTESKNDTVCIDHLHLYLYMFNGREEEEPTWRFIVGVSVGVVACRRSHCSSGLLGLCWAADFTIVFGLHYSFL